MHKIYLLLTAVLLLQLPATGKVVTQDTSWSAHPVLHTVDPQFATYEAVILEESMQIDNKDVSNETWTYVTQHRTVKVLDEKGIETFNKMIFPMYEGIDIVTLKARTIQADGKVVEITRDKFKTSKDEDGSPQLIFAMEGVEKNAEIEYVFAYRKPYTVFGSVKYQYSLPIEHGIFQLSCPRRIIFEAKGFNGFPDATDTLIDDTRYMLAEKSKIPALQSEEYSFYDLNSAHLEYKVSYVPEEHQNVRVYTWQDLTNKLYDRTYKFTSRELAETDRFLETLKVEKSDDEATKIKKIENGIKTNITYYKEIESDKANDIDYIVAKKSATEGGFNRLFNACFKQAGVTAELGLTTNRFAHLFDPAFENWNNMEFFVYYFPGTKKFLAPTATFYRYPFVPAAMLTNKGVFCKLTTLGDVTSAIADIRTIAPVPTSDNENDIDATITFNADFDAQVAITSSMTGYCACGIREAALLMPKEKTNDFLIGILNIIDKADNIVDYKISNAEFENYFDNKPLLITAKVNTPQLVEKAGAKYILKLGDIIGKQQELYQAKERKTPIDLSYNHSLNRKIVVMIPDGYKILNPETININAAMKDAEGKESCAFHSAYTLEGNKLTVSITEFYSQYHYLASEYEPFRKVINASADFNKVNLLLGKQ